MPDRSPPRLKPKCALMRSSGIDGNQRSVLLTILQAVAAGATEGHLPSKFWVGLEIYPAHGLTVELRLRFFSFAVRGRYVYCQTYRETIQSMGAPPPSHSFTVKGL